MWIDPVSEAFDSDEKHRKSTLATRLKAFGQTIAEDPGVRQGALQIAMSLGALIMRAVTPKRPALVPRGPERK